MGYDEKFANVIVMQYPTASQANSRKKYNILYAKCPENFLFGHVSALAPIIRLYSFIILSTF